MVEIEALNALVGAWTGLGFFLLLSLIVLVPMLIFICWFKLCSMNEKDLKKKKEQEKQEIVDIFNEIQKGGR